MASALDKSLDDIIKSRPKVRRGGARRTSKTTVVGRSSIGSNPATLVRAAAKGAAKSPPTVSAVTQATDKIIVSNLPLDVNEAQIKELFQTTVGPLREVNLHHDPAGRSKGVASVTFSRKGDGTKAYTQYNNRLIDGS